MKVLIALLSLIVAGYVLFRMGAAPPEVKHKVEEVLSTGSFHTLELRHTASQIMDAHRKELLKSTRHKFLEPSLKFYPYLLMEIKYSASDDKTKEGVILWDLTDGEMVIETKEWQKTHGFGDCIQAGTDRHEFKVINALAKKGGVSDRESLSKMLHVESDILDAWLESCRRKKLIVQAGNRYRLHLENPRLKILPATKLEERLVTKPYRNAERLSKHFSLSQIEKLTRAAFGNDFTIRKTSDVFLPVHCIVVQNPDGSLHTSHWNALTGSPMTSYLVD